MKRNNKLAVLAVIAAAAGPFSTIAVATPIVCEDTTVNHMVMDDTQASGCLGAGVGNISGNPATDDWLLSGGSSAGYTLSSKDDASNPFSIMTTQAMSTSSGSSGTWSIDPSFWLTNTVGAIGFKFGTGNRPDEWFVFELIQGVSSGTWEFINVFRRGGGLSHTNLYSTNEPPHDVPEPGALGLLGLGLIGLAISRRKRVA
jgi:hypothetical protein